MPHAQIASAIEARPGEHIRTVAMRAATAADERHEPVEFLFNDVLMTVAPGAEAESVVTEYEVKCEERRAAYRASPEGIAAAKARAAEIVANQAEVDALMAELPTARSDIDVIDWLCAYAREADDIDVKAPHAAVADYLEGLGYRRGENVGRTDLANDRVGMARWIIGQALDFLRRGYPPHGVIHHFRDKHRGMAA